MSLQFYQIARIVELAYIQSQQETIGLLLSLREQVAKAGAVTEAEIIHHAAAQLARGQSVMMIQVDGSAAELALDVPIPEPAPEPAAPAPTHVQPRRKRRV
jgi:hypothetical protein